MRIKLLISFLVLLCLCSCKENTSHSNPENSPLYPAPLTVALNTDEGYTINKITGDSIKPLISPLGDTIKTGEPIPLIAEHLNQENGLKTKTIEAVHTIKTIIPDNIHRVPDNLSVTIVDTAHLKKVKFGEGDQSFVLRNTYGIVKTGVPIPVTGKKMPFSEPPPVKALPMRFKDNATASIQYLDVDQGLSYSFAEAVCEDKRGNLWFGIDGTGISKYDGISITTYTVKEGLTNNVITSIMEDRNNNLWIGTQGGVSCFDGKNFTQYTEKEGLASNQVYSIFEDRAGILWFSTLEGLTRYDGKCFENFTQKEGLPSGGLYRATYKCIEDRKGDLWIGTYHGLLKFDGQIFTQFTPKDGLTSYIVPDLLEDKKGNIWIGSAGEGLSVFDGKKIAHFTTKEGLSDNITWAMIEDHDGNIWISTSGGGLNKYDGKNFINYSTKQGLSNNKIRGMTEDRAGNIWLATEGGGINKINQTNFDYQIPNEVVENNRIRPILKDKKGNLWFGTESANVGKLNAENTGGKGKIFTYYILQEGLKKGQRSLLEDAKGNIWIGTTGAGIIKYDGKNFTKYLLGPIEETQSTFDILEDKKGNIWFGQRDGTIVRYDGAKFSLYTIKKGLPGSIIYSMLEDKQGNIWFCTEGAGVYKYNGTTLMIYSEKEGLFNKSVTSIAEDSEGNIWLGTVGSGVCKFDGQHFTYYTEQQGLANNNVWSVFCDSANQLWFGTNKGLTLFIPQKEDGKGFPQISPSAISGYAIYNFGLQDGLKGIDFNLHSVCADKENHIWWGTGKSAPSFDLSKGFHADSLRSLSLNYLEINDRFYDFRNIPDSIKKEISFVNTPLFYNYPEALTLSHNQNHLSFHFSAIDWSAPEKIKYSYRLLGSGENSSELSPEPFSEYRNLRPGHYELQVKAIGQSQKWTEPISYKFTIRPPWWQTWWFWTIIIGVAVALIFLVIRFIYFYQLRKQKVIMEKQLAIQFERQRISAEMHDDIGAGLSGIRLMTEMAKLKSKNPEDIQEIENIHESVSDISSKMKEVIWSLNKENDSLASLISYLEKQVRLSLKNYHGQLSVDLPGKIPDIEISGEARRNIYLAIKEAVHNIIKHSEADKINLSIKCEEKLVITISDNGKGLISSGGDNSGNGLKNMKQRMEKLGGSLAVEDHNGVSITFEIPLKQFT